MTDSESADSSLLVPQSEACKRKAAAIKRCIRRKRANTIAKQNFLGRCKSKCLPSIVQMYPGIGNTIEKFVEECNVGADSWRCTGLLTFNGNTKVGKTFTYKQIQEHLNSIYPRHFSYGQQYNFV